MAVEDGYEVYVNPEAIIEINRGEHMTTVQAFGEDWQAAPAVHIHAPAMAPPPELTLDEIASEIESWPTLPPAPAWKPPDPPHKRLFYAFVAILAGLAAWLIVRPW